MTPLFTLFHELRHDLRCRVLAVAASPQAAETGDVWRLLHAGATGVLVWTANGGAAQVAARLQRWFEVDELAEQAISRQSLIGDSPALHAAVRKIVEAARFSTIPVLLTGESGTGKEMLAKLISVVCASPGGTQEFRKELITVDCASLVPELSGSEFFGHERGAFTGAHVQREGAFAMADGATLLLDEIGEVPLVLQAQLLRAIQEKTYKRVDGNVWQKTRFRLICATNRFTGSGTERPISTGSLLPHCRPRHSDAGARGAKGRHSAARQIFPERLLFAWFAGTGRRSKPIPAEPRVSRKYPGGAAAH